MGPKRRPKLKIRRSTKLHREGCFNSLHVGTIITPLHPEYQAQASQPKKVIYKDEAFSLKAKIMIAGVDGRLSSKPTMGLSKLVHFYTWEGKPIKKASIKVRPLVNPNAHIAKPEINGGKLHQRVNGLETQLGEIKALLVALSKAPLGERV